MDRVFSSYLGEVQSLREFVEGPCFEFLISTLMDLKFAVLVILIVLLESFL